MQCVIASAFTLETAILYSLSRGLNMDSSYRNKNNLRCLVTILSTSNESYQMASLSTTSYPGLPISPGPGMSIQSSFAIRSFSSREANTRAFLGALRKCQRCPIEIEWPEYYQRFRQDIDNIAQDGGQSTISLTTYLNREWFSHRWRSYCVNYGIPAHLMSSVDE